jgi:hypothetical protein
MARLPSYPVVLAQKKLKLEQNSLELGAGMVLSVLQG